MAIQPNSSNSRRYERANELILVNYRILDFQKDLGDFDEGMTASTIDMSAGGMLLRMTENLPPRTLMDLRFTIKPGTKEIIVMSVVVNVKPAEYEGVFYVAVEYPMLSEADKAIIDAYVKEINQRRG